MSASVESSSPTTSLSTAAYKVAMGNQENATPPGSTKQASVKSGSALPDSASPGKLSIVFSVPHEDRQNEVQMQFDLTDSDYVVDRMLHRLVGKFPPDTVVTVESSGKGDRETASVAKAIAGGRLENFLTEVSDTPRSASSTTQPQIAVPLSSLPFILSGRQLLPSCIGNNLERLMPVEQASTEEQTAALSRLSPNGTVFAHFPSTGVVVTSIPLGDQRNCGILTATGHVIVGTAYVSSTSKAAVRIEDGRMIEGVRRVGIWSAPNTMTGVILSSGLVARGERHVVDDRNVPGVETTDGRIIHGERHIFVTAEGFVVSKASRATPTVTHHSAILTKEGHTILGKRHFFTEEGIPAVTIGTRLIQGIQHTTVASVQGALPAITLADGRIVVGKRHGVNDALKPVLVTADDMEVEGKRHIFISPPRIATGLNVSIPLVKTAAGFSIAGLKSVKSMKNTTTPSVVLFDGRIVEGVSEWTAYVPVGVDPAVILEDGSQLVGDTHTVSEDTRPGVMLRDGTVVNGVTHSFVLATAEGHEYIQHSGVDATAQEPTTEPADSARSSVSSSETSNRVAAASRDLQSSSGAGTHRKSHYPAEAYEGAPCVVTPRGYVIIGEPNGATSVRTSDGSVVNGQPGAVPCAPGSVVGIMTRNGEIVKGGTCLLSAEGAPALRSPSGDITEGVRHIFVAPDDTVDDLVCQGFPSFSGASGDGLLGLMSMDGSVIIGQPRWAAGGSSACIDLPDGSSKPGCVVRIDCPADAYPAVIQEDGSTFVGIGLTQTVDGKPAIIAVGGEIVAGDRHVLVDPDGLRGKTSMSYLPSIIEGEAPQLGRNMSSASTPSVPVQPKTLRSDGYAAVLTPDNLVVVGREQSSTSGQSRVITDEGSVVTGTAVPLNAPATGLPGVLDASGRLHEGVAFTVTEEGVPAVRRSDGSLVSGVRHVFKPSSTPSVSSGKKSAKADLGQQSASTGQPAAAGTAPTGGHLASASGPDGRRSAGVPGSESAHSSKPDSLSAGTSSSASSVSDKSHGRDGKSSAKAVSVISAGKTKSVPTRGFPAVITAGGEVVSGKMCITAPGVFAVEVDGQLVVGKPITLVGSAEKNVTPAVVSTSRFTAPEIKGVSFTLDTNGRPAVRTTTGRVFSGMRHVLEDKDGLISTDFVPAFPQAIGPAPSPDQLRVAAVRGLGGTTVVGRPIRFPTGEMGVQMPDSTIAFGSPVTLTRMAADRPAIQMFNDEVAAGTIFTIDGNQPAIVTQEGNTIAGVTHGFVRPDGEFYSDYTPGFPDGNVDHLSEQSLGGSADVDSFQPLEAPKSMVSSTLSGSQSHIPSVLGPDGSVLASGTAFVLNGVNHPGVINAEGQTFFGTAIGFQTPCGSVITTDETRSFATTNAMERCFRVPAALQPSGHVIAGQLGVDGELKISCAGSSVYGGSPVSILYTRDGVPAVERIDKSIVAGTHFCINSTGKPAVLMPDGVMVSGERHLFQSPAGDAETRLLPSLPAHLPFSVGVSLQGQPPRTSQSKPQGLAPAVVTAEGAVFVGSPIIHNGLPAIEVDGIILAASPAGLELPLNMAVTPAVVTPDGSVLSGSKFAAASDGSRVMPAVITAAGDLIPGVSHVFVDGDNCISQALLPGFPPNLPSSVVESPDRVQLVGMRHGDNITIGDAVITPTGDTNVHLPDGSVLGQPMVAISVPSSFVRAVVTEDGNTTVGVTFGSTPEGQPSTVTHDGTFVTGVRHTAVDPKTGIVEDAAIADTTSQSMATMMGSTMMGSTMMGSTMMGSTMMGSTMMGSTMMGSTMMGSVQQPTAHPIRAEGAVVVDVPVAGDPMPSGSWMAPTSIPTATAVGGLSLDLTQNAIDGVPAVAPLTVTPPVASSVTHHDSAIHIGASRLTSVSAFPTSLETTSMASRPTSTMPTSRPALSTSSVVLSDARHKINHASYLVADAQRRQTLSTTWSLGGTKATAYAGVTPTVTSADVFSQTTMNGEDRNLSQSQIVAEEFLAETPRDTIKYVEVPVIQEIIKHVPKKEIVEIERKVPRTEIEWVEVVKEVPQIQWVDRTVEVPQIQQVIRHVPKKEIIEVPREVIRHVPKIETQIVEKIINVPEIIEVPVPQIITKEVYTTQVDLKETPLVVAQSVHPTILESEGVLEVRSRTYEPKVVPVDVYIPLPVETKITDVVRTQFHQAVDVSIPVYNALVRAVNPHATTVSVQETLPFLVHTPTDTVPIMPLTERFEVVMPLSNEWMQTHSSGEIRCNELDGPQGAAYVMRDGSTIKTPEPRSATSSKHNSPRRTILPSPTVPISAKTTRVVQKTKTKVPSPPKSSGKQSASNSHKRSRRNESSGSSQGAKTPGTKISRSALGRQFVTGAAAAPEKAAASRPTTAAPPQRV